MCFRLAAITFYVDVRETVAAVFIFQPSLLNLMKEMNELTSFRMPFSSSPAQISVCKHPAFICMTPKPTLHEASFPVLLQHKDQEAFTLDRI